MGRTLGMHLASRLAEVGVKVRAINIGFQHQASSEHAAMSSHAFGLLISACCPAGLVHSPW